jgi:hypothetical protein
MKNLFMCLLLSVSTVNVFAAEEFDQHRADVNEKGFELLYNNMEKVNLVGQLKEGESLKVFLQDTADFYGHIFGGIFSMGDDEEDEKDIKLESAAPDCKPIPVSMGHIGRCELKMEYKTGDKVTIVFDVKLKNKMPVALHSHKVMVFRK